MPRKQKAPSPQSDFCIDHISRPARSKPAGPVITSYWPPRGLSYPPIPFETKRHWLSCTWNPMLPTVAFLTYQQVRMENGHYAKLRRWCYLNHYGGMFLTNLFPVDTNELTEWREITRRVLEDKEGNTLRRIMLEGARQAGRQSRQMRVRKLVVATGHMRDETEAAMLFDWIATFRDQNRGSSLKCFGTTPAGRWGVAVAVTGRAPIDVDTLKLQTWMPPWTIKQRHEARLNQIRLFMSPPAAEGASA